MSTVNNVASNELLSKVNSNKVSTAAADSVQDTTDRFMKLLVAQMTNQDPMNPLDNAQVTSQLAQLSTVTGINQLNATLESLQASMLANQSLDAASMIGHGVLAPGSSFNLSEGVSVFGVDLKGSADSVKVKILDSNGTLVHTIDLGAQEAGVIPVAWDGTLDGTTTVPDGRYTLQVSANTSAGTQVNANPLSFGEVVSVTRGDAGVTLNVSGIGEVQISDVRQIL